MMRSPRIACKFDSTVQGRPWEKVCPGFKFGLVTAVATDKDDNLFVFHRGKQPTVVFDKHGQFLRSWGDGTVKTAHGLRLDGDGNV